MMMLFCLLLLKLQRYLKLLLTLLSRLCVGVCLGTLDLYIEACKKTNRERKIKGDVGLQEGDLVGGED